MQRKVIIAGGGTGGHIFPAIAIANALKAQTNGDIDILFVGAKGKMEMEKVPQAGYRIEGLEIVGFNRSNIFKNILLPFKLIKSLGHANRILREFKPDVVVGVGGFASFPMLDRAQRHGIPTLIQEQNSFAGKANKVLSHRAARICTGYDGMEKFFPASKILVTGNPVRSSITQSHATRNESLVHFGLDTNRKTVFVVGGSLGAKSINEAIHALLASFVEKDVQLIWQTGKPYFETAKAAAAPFSSHVKVLEFITNMDQAYAAADVVISRAGALAIAELCVVKKATVFVPYPFAAEDHQTSNAMSLVNKKAALLLKDSEVGTQLGTTLFSLLQNKALIEQLETNIAGLANPHADRTIAEEVLKLVR